MPRAIPPIKQARIPRRGSIAAAAWSNLVTASSIRGRGVETPEDAQPHLRIVRGRFRSARLPKKRQERVRLPHDPLQSLARRPRKMLADILGIAGGLRSTHLLELLAEPRSGGHSSNLSVGGLQPQREALAERRFWLI